ncbi:MAG: recombination regulator RecX [Gallionella sp.]|jgi:regulatory protein|nr:recombination regulator RecX [Gallionella sp.]
MQLAVKPKTEISLRVRAMRYLARREYSRHELLHKLRPYLQEGDDLEAVLDDLERRNWLSDTRAAEQLLRLSRTRFGTQRIVHELRQKGIAESLINAAVPALREDELTMAREVWLKKFGSPPQDMKEKARQVRFLQSRGFSMDVIFKLLRMDEEAA